MTALSTQALAATSATSQTFGIVDMNRVLQTTDAAKSIFKQMDAKRKSYQAEIAREEDKIRSSEESLEKQKDTL
ncbi:MAG: OmpH family outer membrane protein, partial [Alphaproteobacteria bacterium]|nr:OmpH family outer membrane protein [Alphaproteobacteria bacterium]